MPKAVPLSDRPHKRASNRSAKATIDYDRALVVKVFGRKTLHIWLRHSSTTQPNVHVVAMVKTNRAFGSSHRPQELR